jgi:FkbM family methyltransferase
MPQSDKNWIFPIGNKDTEIFQRNHRDIILKFLKKNNCKFRHCCDVGAHIGIWSNDFVQQFEWVHAFEPIEELRNCYEKNVTKSNYTLYPFGLGSSETEIKLQYAPEHGSNTQVNPLGNYTSQIRKLDNLNLPNIDYIKMDAEGYELEILKGATNLLLTQSPIIHLEMKLGTLSQFHLTKHDVRSWLLKFNYKQALKIINEFVFVKDATIR